MTATQLVNYVHAHSFPAWEDEDGTIHIVLSWVRREADGSLVTGHDVECVPPTMDDVQNLICQLAKGANQLRHECSAR